MASAGSRNELEAWQAATAQNTPDAYYFYLSLFPAGDYVDEAIQALGNLGAIGQTRAIIPTPNIPSPGPPPRDVGGNY